MSRQLQGEAAVRRRTVLLGLIIIGATAATAGCSSGDKESPFGRGVTGLFVVAPDGSQLKRLANALDVSWSPDGRRLAFVFTESDVSILSAYPSDIYVVGTDRVGAKRIGESPQTETSETSGNFDPAWSSDGGRIAFVHGRLSTELQYRIFVANANRSETKFLAVGLDPEWSPDDEQLVFIRGDPFSDIWVIRSDGRTPRRLTRSPADEYAPRWSPDGSRIAFSSPRGIFVMNADGKRLRQITRGLEGIPTWSPDGTKIAFEREGAALHGALYIVNADGSGLKKLRKEGGDPAWSPDGKEIAFATGRGILLQNLETHQLRPLPTPLDDLVDDAPAWSPDGSRIAFVRSRVEHSLP
jgi:Tol biopolymer transport system component